MSLFGIFKKKDSEKSHHDPGPHGRTDEPIRKGEKAQDEEIVSNENRDYLLPAGITPEQMERLEKIMPRNRLTIVDRLAFSAMRQVLHRSLPLLTDGQGNYICIYILGPFKGKIYQLMHDEPDVMPLFHDAELFITCLENNPQMEDIYQFSSYREYGSLLDYPAKNDYYKEDNLRMIAEVKSEMPGYNSDEMYQMENAMMMLTPQSMIEELLYPLLETGDQATKATAVGFIRFFKHIPALPLLEKMAADPCNKGF